MIHGVCGNMADEAGSIGIDTSAKGGGDRGGIDICFVVGGG